MGQGSSIVTPRPPQAGHGEENENRPWLSDTTPWPPQLRAACGLVPGAAPEPLQVWQGASLVRCTAVVTPGDGVVEGEVQLGLEVLAAVRAPPAAAAAPRRPPPTEQAAEQVAEVAGVAVNAEAARPPRARRGSRPPAGPSRRTSSYSLRRSALPTTS